MEDVLSKHTIQYYYPNTRVFSKQVRLFLVAGATIKGLAMGPETMHSFCHRPTRTGRYLKVDPQKNIQERGSPSPDRRKVAIYLHSTTAEKPR